MPARKLNLDELLAQLPETDKQVEAKQPPPPPDAPKKRREPDPDPGAAGSKFTGPDPELARRLVEQVLAHGRDGLTELIGRIRDIADPAFEDYRAEKSGSKHRNVVADTLAAHLVSPKLSIGLRQLLIQELQWVGGARSVQKLGRLLADEQLCESAAMALLSMGNDGAAAFRKALPKATGKCRLVSLQALGQLRDKKSVEHFRRAIEDPDMDVRLCAAWALARTADAGSARTLVSLAARSTGYARSKATQACLVLAENMAATGRKREARDIYAAVREQTQEAYIREVASKAIAGLDAT
jgi:HEAT repeat protein